MRQIPRWGGILSFPVTFLVLMIVPGLAGAFDLPERIREAEPGDTLRVPAGRYPGPISVEKPLQLIAEGDVRIDGRRKTHTLSIRSDSVTVEGFTLLNSGRSLEDDHAGIHVKGDSVVLRNNVIRDSLHGIYVYSGENVRIIDNRIVGLVDDWIYDQLAGRSVEKSSSGASSGKQSSDDNMHVKFPTRSGNGIHFWRCQYVVLRNNEVSNVRDGYYFSFTEDSVIENNYAHRTRYGLHYMYSHRNEITRNRFERNLGGVALMFSRHLEVEDNIIRDHQGSRAMGILLQDVDSSRFAGNRSRRNRTGLSLQNAHRNTFTRNTMSLNEKGMNLESNATLNEFSENVFLRNHRNLGLTANPPDNEWSLNERGNYWSGSLVVDLTGDGVGNLPHTEVDVLGPWEDQFDYSSLLNRSPLISWLQFALSRTQVPGAWSVTDPYPLARPGVDSRDG